MSYSGGFQLDCISSYETYKESDARQWGIDLMDEMPGQLLSEVELTEGGEGEWEEVHYCSTLR